MSERCTAHLGALRCTRDAHADRGHIYEASAGCDLARPEVDA